jgi:hypothetical protein
MTAEKMSLTAFAKRVGSHKVAVSRAFRSGRLKNSVQRDENGRPWIVDVELADREWAEVDRSRAPGYVKERDGQPVQPPPAEADAKADDDYSRGGRPPGKPSPLAEASAQEKRWRAQMAELKFRERAGELVEAAGVAKEIATIFAACRSKLLGLPSRVKQEIPDLTYEHIETMDRIAREICEDLAIPDRFKTNPPTVQ